jgi:hypothetical protein
MFRNFKRIRTMNSLYIAIESALDEPTLGTMLTLAQLMLLAWRRAASGPVVGLAAAVGHRRAVTTPVESSSEPPKNFNTDKSASTCSEPL